MPALPEQLKEKYMTQYALTEYDASVICNDKEDADFFEELIKYTVHSKPAANWLLGPLKFYCNEHSISMADFPLEPQAVSSLIDLSESGKVNFNNASTSILHEMIRMPAETAVAIANSLNLLQESDANSIEIWVNEVIASMPEKVKEYKSGKKGLIGLFAGEVKKKSKGKADMQVVNKLLSEKLKH